jgi:hypothetical protein
MENFWNNIEYPKLDITKYGHSTGTGIVNCSGQNIEMSIT